MNEGELLAQFSQPPDLDDAMSVTSSTCSSASAIVGRWWNGKDTRYVPHCQKKGCNHAHHDLQGEYITPTQRRNKELAQLKKVTACIILMCNQSLAIFRSCGKRCQRETKRTNIFPIWEIKWRRWSVYFWNFLTNSNKTRVYCYILDRDIQRNTKHFGGRSKNDEKRADWEGSIREREEVVGEEACSKGQPTYSGDYDCQVSVLTCFVFFTCFISSFWLLRVFSQKQTCWM